ncbi:MAG TPA: hypothetical protein DET40_21325 [Lentisphaeria bacterium]|nr:MAG: hypothetical protein A2X45_03235 [Lentisphaerae bacterium GWF2_50_93]HCE46094.1 hypothetical protein [Lentisphaeria bacterium]
MIDKLILAILMLVSIQLFSQSDKPDKPDRPAVIAVGGFANNYGWSKENVHTLVALRDRVVSDLVRNYDCIVLSRSKGYDMAMEKAINTVSVIDKKAAPDAIPAADYAITGYFDWGARTGTNRVNVDFVLITTNPAEKSRSDFTTVKINDESMWPIDKVSGKISARIAKELNLKKRPDKELGTGKIDEVWAVLPFSRLEDLKKFKMPPDEDLAVKAELALQESNRLKAIVDHKAISSTLTEMKVSSLSGATEGFAGGLARIVGADRIIMGSVSSSYEKGNDLRVDLLLVDGKTSVVVDSRSALCSRDTVDKAVADEVLEFLKHKYVSVLLDNSTPEMRKKEAQLYLDVGRAIRVRTNSYDAEMILNSAGFFDSAYYLACGDDEILYKTAEKMIGIMGNKEFAKQFPDIVVELGRKVEEMLVNMKPSEKCKFPYLQRADAKNIQGRYEDALKLADEQIKNEPRIENVKPNAPPPFSVARALMVKSDAYIGLKEYDNALGCLEKLPPVGFITVKRVDICRLQGDEKKELEYLKQMQMHGYALTEYPIRLFMLMKKHEGPASAIKYADEKFSSWTVHRTEYQIELAKACMESGDKKRAATIIDVLNRDFVFGGMERESKERAAEAKELKKQIGDFAGIEWKTAGQVKKIPEKYKIYLQPLGDMQMMLLEGAAKKMRDYFGGKVEILPILPMPKDPDCFKKERGQHDAKSLIERVVSAVGVPKDAVFIAYFTKESIYQDDLRYVYGSYYSSHGGTVISYHMLHSDEFNNLSDIIVKSAACMLVNRHLPGCRNFSCINITSGKMDGASGEQLAMCEDCQKNYRGLDFDDLFDELQNRYPADIRANIRKKTGADRDLSKWNDEYKQQVKVALEKPKHSVGAGKTEASGKIDMPVKGYRFSICGEKEQEPGKQVVLGRKKWTGPKDCSAEGIIGMDDNGITVTVDVRDDSLVACYDTLYDDDGLDLYFDFRPEDKRNDTYEKGVFQITAVPFFYDAAPNSFKFFKGGKDYDSSVKGVTIKSAPLGDKGYRMQVFIPFEGLAVAHFLPKDSFKFDLAVNDADEEGRDHQIMWHGTTNNWNTPRNFGEIKIQDCK